MGKGTNRMVPVKDKCRHLHLGLHTQYRLGLTGLTDVL